MTVRDLLNTKQRKVITCKPSTSILQAMEFLINNRISCLPVLNDDNELVGILSDKDIFHCVHDDCAGFSEMTVGNIMTTNVIVGLETDEIGYIAGIMTNNRIRHVPIVEDARLVGLLSTGDIVKTQMTNMYIENRYLWQYINGTYPA